MLFVKRRVVKSPRQCIRGCKIGASEDYYIEDISGDAASICEAHFNLYKENLSFWGVTLSSSDIMELRLVKE